MDRERDFAGLRIKKLVGKGMGAQATRKEGLQITELEGKIQASRRRRAELLELGTPATASPPSQVGQALPQE
jgi:hypothetical protein